MATHDDGPVISAEPRPAEGDGVAVRAGVVIYGVLAYVAFLAAALYAVGFLADTVVPRTVDSGGRSPAPQQPS